MTSEDDDPGRTYSAKWIPSRAQLRNYGSSVQEEVCNNQVSDILAQAKFSRRQTQVQEHAAVVHTHQVWLTITV